MHRNAGSAIALLFAFLSTASAQNSAFDIRKAIVDVAVKAENAKEYSFEAELQLDGQRGTSPGRNLAKAKVKLAVAPDGKYSLSVEPAEADEYLLISNGQKSWAYVPRLKQYSEEESAVSTAAEGEEDEGASDTERDQAQTFARQVVPILARMARTAASANAAKMAEVKFHGKKQSLPVIQVFSKKSEQEGQSLTEMVLDPATLELARLVYANVIYQGGEKNTMRLELNFRQFNIGQKIPESTFAFEPPGKAKLVDAVPIPGQTGSLLLNKPAPDFELKTLDGEKIRLTELRRPVLLSFWASWCPPCRRELPELAKIHDEYESKGLLILGINDEGRGTAKSFAEKAHLPFATLDDSSRKAHRLYRVRSIPTVFLIDREGKIVRFFRGARNEATFRAALKSVGL